MCCLSGFSLAIHYFFPLQNYGFDFIRKLKWTQVVQLLYMKTSQEMLTILDIRLLEVSYFLCQVRYSGYCIWLWMNRFSKLVCMISSYWEHDFFLKSVNLGHGEDECFNTIHDLFFTSLISLCFLIVSVCCCWLVLCEINISDLLYLLPFHCLNVGLSHQFLTHILLFIPLADQPHH